LIRNATRRPGFRAEANDLQSSLSNLAAERQSKAQRDEQFPDGGELRRRVQRFLQSRGRVVAGESQDHVGPDLELHVDLSAAPPVRSSAFGTLVR
jgi:hypothetical protein